MYINSIQSWNITKSSLTSKNLISITETIRNYRIIWIYLISITNWNRYKIITVCIAICIQIRNSITSVLSIKISLVRLILPYIKPKLHGGHQICLLVLSISYFNQDSDCLIRRWTMCMRCHDHVVVMQNLPYVRTDGKCSKKLVSGIGLWQCITVYRFLFHKTCLTYQCLCQKQDLKDVSCYMCRLCELGLGSIK